MSPLKRGSRIWEKGRMFIFYRNICKSQLLQCLAEDFSLSTCSLSSLTRLRFEWEIPEIKNAEHAQANTCLYIFNPYVWVE